MENISDLTDAELAVWLETAKTPEGTRAFFAQLIEPLGDLFESALCDVYVNLFTRVLERACGLSAVELRERYERVRRRTAAPVSVANVFVLSRVTLGADIAVTSVVLDAAKKRFPDARIHLVGSRKNWELFEADPRIGFLPAPYARGATLDDRLQVSIGLRNLLDHPDSLVIDPDSRLTQLGLVSVCDEERYLFFESRSFGGDGSETLPVLTAQWTKQTLGVDGARAYVAPMTPNELTPDVTVSLGVGENPAKRAPDPFEQDLFAHLERTGASVLVDYGAGGEESERVDRVLRPGMRTWRGAFAPFAAQIARSRVYVGYDSAGQHAAAASGVPVVCVFRGEASERTYARWRPHGAGPVAVIRDDDPLAAACAAIDKFLGKS
ncbi:MAG: hypothetical protein ABI823_09995 [Bryobacteraceae bacterium]